MTSHRDQDGLLTRLGEAVKTEAVGDGQHTQIVDLRPVRPFHKCRLTVPCATNRRELVLEQDRIRIGAHVSNDVVVEDRTASRHHCEIQRTEKGYLLVDLGSTNGTWLDGRRVERAYLSTGATIRIGATLLGFSLVDDALDVTPDSDGRLGQMVGRSAQMREVFELIRKSAPMDVSVIIGGETGTGKELAARAIHELSPRRDGPFVVLDCSAIPPNLIESELFGHEKGAFTGAISTRPGAFERANGGTIFLDELGELRIDLQPKLLRVLENREVRRVGSNAVIDVDVRVVAATNRDLLSEIREGNFREDLFFRLSVIHIAMPPLRARREDVPFIVRDVLGDPETVARHGRKRFTPAALEALMAYHWPGNVRELMNVLSHVLTFSEGEEVDIECLPARLRGEQKIAPVPFNEHLSYKKAREQLLETFEREYVESVLRRCGGNISRAARESGLHRKSIERLVKKHRLDARAMKVRAG